MTRSKYKAGCGSFLQEVCQASGSRERSLCSTLCRMQEASCCRTTLAFSKMSSASFEAFSWAEDRTKQGSKVSHQIPTRNNIAFPCTFFVHNRQAPLQFIIGRGCPYDIATPAVNAGLLENFSCHWTAFILHPSRWTVWCLCSTSTHLWVKGWAFTSFCLISMMWKERGCLPCIFYSLLEKWKSKGETVV